MQRQDFRKQSRRQCKFGKSCKYINNCRFKHFSQEKSSNNNPSKEFDSFKKTDQIQNLQHKFSQMQIENYQKMSDAQYQQLMTKKQMSNSFSNKQEFNYPQKQKSMYSNHRFQHKMYGRGKHNHHNNQIMYASKGQKHCQENQQTLLYKQQMQNQQYYQICNQGYKGRGRDHYNNQHNHYDHHKHHNHHSRHNRNSNRQYFDQNKNDQLKQDMLESKENTHMLQSSSNKYKLKSNYPKNKQQSEQSSSNDDENQRSSSNSNSKYQKHKIKKLTSNQKQPNQKHSGKSNQCKMPGKWFKNNSNPQNQKLYLQLSESFYVFFQKRSIKQHKKQKILKYLCKNYPSSEISNLIIPIYQILEQQNLTQFLGYKKVIKTICKQNFIIDDVRRKLLKKIHIQDKINKKDVQFYQRYPNPVNVYFMQKDQLISNQMNYSNSIYLIDGNNCMVAQKHIRSYFQSADIQKKVQAQLRFIWIAALTICDPKRCFIFFDNKYPQQMMEKIRKQILYQNQYKQVLANSTVIYAQNSQQADTKIKIKLRQLKQTLSPSELNNIILFTADRILTQQCYQIIPLRKSSGLNFFKFSRKIIKQKHYHTDKKGIMKRIFYDRFKEQRWFS